MGLLDGGIGKVSRATLEAIALAAEGAEQGEDIPGPIRALLDKARAETLPPREDATALRMRLANARALLQRTHALLSVPGEIDAGARGNLVFDIEALEGRV